MYEFYITNGMRPPQYGRLRKTLMVMKITTLLLITAILHVSASSLAQKVTLHEKNAALTDVFDQIRSQTHFDFVFTSDDLKNARPVTINVTNEELKDALSQIFAGQPLDFSIENQSVVVKEKEASLIDRLKATLAQITVQGKVQDELGSPLAGATVRIKDSQQATATDKNGAFTITVPSDKTVLVFSFTGYEPVELQAKDIAGGSVITLKASTTNLHEVIVNKGYYQERQELSTGSTGRITAKEIQEQPVSDPIMALEGRVAGLSISQASGVPGAAYNIELRGRNSIQSSTNPLYIVDGMPFTANSMTSTFVNPGILGRPATPPATASVQSGPNGLSPFNVLNPADIENIEVLKDADATAIYGSQGSNGVILITTKKGKPGQTKVDIDASSGIGRVTRMIPMLNTQQYLALRHEAFKNDGATPNPNNDYDITGSWDTTRYTNWQKLIIGNTAHYNNLQGSVSGGNSGTQFYFGGGYSRQTTVFPGDYSDTKGSGRLNINHQSANQKFNANINVQYGYERNIVPTTNFVNFITLAPDAPAIYDAKGNLNWQNNTWSNPIAFTNNTNSSAVNNFMGNLNLTYEILTGLKVGTSAGYNDVLNDQQWIQRSTSSPPPYLASQRSNSFGTTKLGTWTVEPQATYTKRFGQHQINALIGATFRMSTQESSAFYASNFTSDDQIKNIYAAGSQNYSGYDYSQYRYNAVFLRVNYIYQDKYILNLTGRRDGSSRFGPANQFGNFGSIGAAWIFSKEAFFTDNFSFLSFGKLRASYGSTGNDGVPNYSYLSTYSSVAGPYQGSAGLTPNRIANPYFAWERNNKLEGGIELGFLNDRINLSVDYYRNRTANQLVGYPLPSVTGFSTVQFNLPAVIQNSGLELEINTTNIKNGNFTWRTAFNISVPRNKLVSYPNIAGSPYAQTYAVGQPLYIRYLLHAKGVDPQTGLYTFEDHNGDGKVDLNDRYFSKTVAQNYYGGLQNSFSYRNFTVDIFFQFVKQTGFNYINAFNYPGIAKTNFPVYVLDYWKKTGDQSTIQKISQNNGSILTQWGNNRSYSDAPITDASFIRLKNVAVTYTLPTKWQHSAGLKNASIYVQGQNLLTITNYLGLDPETQSLNLPPLRMISLGFRVSL